MSNKIKMVDDNILVYISLPSTETEAGLIVSEEVAREMQKDITGEVVAVGPNVKNFEKGDTILLPPGGSIPVSYDDSVYHVFKEFALFAKITK
tara:strand:+ start:700 stop:978 length:279 start_codon:yes stop_codon:yes gene_type:complete